MSTAIIPYEPQPIQRARNVAPAAVHLVTPLALPPQLESFLPAYLAALKARGNRPRGIKKYSEGIRHFFRWLGPDATMAAITFHSIERYQEARAATCSPGTVGFALTVIRSFCKWALRRKLRPDDPTTDLDWPKKPATAPRALKYAELRALMQAITSEPAQLGPVRRWHWHRNRRAIYLMLFAGLRIAEASALRWRDVDLEAGELWVRDGKGGKDRCLPLHQALQFELELVPEAERLADWAVVPAGASGECVTPKSLAHIFERWLPALGITINAHRLRHAFATNLLSVDADLMVIKELMGHVSLNTTARYLSTDTKRKRAAVDRLPSTW